LLQGKRPVVANPSYAAYTWSAVSVDVPPSGNAFFCHRSHS
jgi:hypothetical protein